MDLGKMKDHEKLDLCKKYFFGGLAFLPFLWFINFVWFSKEAFRREAFEQQAEIKKYVIRSGIGSLIWTTILITWIVVFQLNRASWGASADYISFIIPTGIP